MMLLLGAALTALLTGTAGGTAEALLASGSQAVTLLITLLGTMPLWSGLLEIMARSGDAARLGKLFRFLLRPLFPGLKDEAAWDAISMNLSANFLGLGNAATPAGIEAARRLAALGEPGLWALAMLLVLDNASLQLIPTTVITLRQAAGAQNPADIWGITLLVSGASRAFAAMLRDWVSGRRGRHGKLGRHGDHPDHRRDRPSRLVEKNRRV